MKIQTIFILSLLCLTLVSAWPYQINLTDGTIVDLNSSNNLTTNLTIYIINNTYLNITNQTYLNVTNRTEFDVMNFTNCTYVTNVTNHTAFYADNVSIYNKTDADSKFLTLSEFSLYKSAITYPSRMEFDVVLNHLNQTNQTLQQLVADGVKETPHGSLWGISILALIIASIVGFITFRNLQESGGIGGSGNKQSFDSQFN